MADEERDLMTDDPEASLLGNEEGGPVIERPKNFPVCKPMMHHDINGEIQHKGLRYFVWVGYVSWYATFVLFTWNLVAVTSILLYVGGVLNFVGVIFALLYLIVGPMTAFFVYKLLYDTARTLRTTTMSFYYCLTVPYTLFCLFLGLGIYSSGGSGLVMMIEEGYAHGWAAFLNGVSMLLWGGYGALNVYMMIALRPYVNAASKQTLPEGGETIEHIDTTIDEKDESIEQGFVYSRTDGGILSAPRPVSAVIRHPEPEGFTNNYSSRPAPTTAPTTPPTPMLVSLDDTAPGIPKEFL